MKSPRVLLVEDDADSAEAIRLLLRTRGIETEWAATAGEAIALYEADPGHAADLILLDLALPDMDGVELIARLGPIASLPPIVIHSAASQDALDRAGEAVGAAAVLRKPTDWKKLLAILGDLGNLGSIRTGAGIAPR